LLPAVIVNGMLHGVDKPSAKSILALRGIMAATGTGKVRFDCGRYISEKVAPPESVISPLSQYAQIH
jgi:hypothetical protein